jgi:hypothetical protein
VATAEVQETFMARNTELTELLKAGAQFVQFLEPYPQAKEQSLYIRSLLRSQAYRAARLCRALGFDIGFNRNSPARNVQITLFWDDEHTVGLEE